MSDDNLGSPGLVNGGQSVGAGRSGGQPGIIFRAIWPVLDERQISRTMLDDATADLPNVAARHGVRITGEPRFEFQPAWRIPGSGNTTRLVLVAHVPAEKAQRPYLRVVGDGSERRTA